MKPKSTIADKPKEWDGMFDDSRYKVNKPKRKILKLRIYQEKEDKHA